MTPKLSESLEFLESWSPSGPWILTSISTDKKTLRTRTFSLLTDAEEFISQEGESQRNIYFTVNPISKAVSSKPSREDVEALAWLHVDIDPREGEDLEEEQERIQGILQNPPDDIPPPTVIAFSGGGMQGFWKLEEPVPINGQEALYEDAKHYNLQLELAFGADSCHNVDRIMRLPGTVNWPDVKKKKKGRKPAVAKVIEWDSSRIYSIDRFEKARQVQSSATGFGQTKMVEVSENVARIDDVKDLPDIADKARVVIVQGDDPDDPYPSRSEAVFYVCCEMVRANIDDNTIFSVLTDPDFRISDSILEKGTNARNYALRQIEQARENAIDPSLVELNEKYAVCPFGGQMRVIYEEWDEMLKRHRLVRMTFENFKNMLMNRRVQSGTDAAGNPRFLPMGKWWLEQEHRRQYNKVVFAPGRQTEGSYNMWRGFAFQGKQGDKHEPFLQHIMENICGGREDLYNYVIGWMASTVQFPDRPGQTAIVLRGDQGVGKGFLAKTLGRLFGRHYVHVGDAKHLTGNFNAHLKDCVVLFADEAFYAGDKRHASVLKTIVTEDMMMYESKGIDAEMTSNCLHILMASNSDWVVPAGFKERRFCVLDVGDAKLQNSKYFAGMQAELSGSENEGYKNLLHFLTSYDLSSYDVRNLPETDALREQKIHSMDPTEEWWYNKLQDGRILEAHDGWEVDVIVPLLLQDFLDYTRSFGVSRRGTATKLGQFLNRAVPELKKYQGTEQVQIEDKTIARPYWYSVPKLDKCRKHWDDKFGGPYKWQEILIEEASGSYQEHF